jgi:hypothetical protein
MLLDRDAVGRAAEGLRPEDFYHDADSVIFTAMLDLFERGEPVDLITVTNRLAGTGKLEGVGGATYIASLPNFVPTAANVDYYIQILQEHKRKRELLALGQRLQHGALNGKSAEELLGVIQDGIAECGTTSLYTLPAVRNRISGPDPRWTPRAIGTMITGGTDAPWVMHGYLARGHTTDMSGLWKVGKTTWLSHLLKALGGGTETFCGRRVAPGKVLLISEESDRLWAIRGDGLGIGGHVEIITRPFLGRPDRTTWERFVAHVAEHVKKNKHAIVIFDSLFNLWWVLNENDAGEVATALAPINAITDAGAAVLLMAHPPKGDAGEGRATRGSGALPGFVDIIVEMRRYDPERRDDSRRTLTAYSRFEETPAEMVLEYDRERGYSVVGTKATARADDRLAVAVDLLPTDPPGVTVEEVLAKWSVDDLPRPSSKTIRRDLDDASAEGIVRRTGAGKRNDPHRYHVGATPGPDSIPDSSGTLYEPVPNGAIRLGGKEP